MKTVWKYTLELSEGERHEVSIPHRAKFLFLKEKEGFMGQDARIDMWWEVDTEQPTEIHTFHVVGTGNEIPHHSFYLGTTFFNRGLYVFHIYKQIDR